MVSTHRNKQILENRERLKPIIESIIFLARQNIPLRGNHDSRKLFKNEDSQLSTVESTINQGHFRELLKYRILSGDSVLEEHLKSENSKATYISPLHQNELIKCCQNFITEKIINEVNENKYFSIIFDETTDVSHTSQMSLVLRYVHKGVVKENFIAFINCHDYAFSSDKINRRLNDEDNEDNLDLNTITLEPKLTGEILGEIVVSTLKDLNLNCMNCVGVATDGCSVMMSTIRGAVQKVQTYAPHAVHCPCSNHSLNLSISKSSSVQAIRNSVGLMKEVISFFNMSSKRNYVLLAVLKGKARLRSLCETRWVERHDSVIIFKSSLPYILEALTAISSWQENDSSSKARTLLTAICTCEFIVSIYSLASLLCVTISVSKILQSVNADISNSTNVINDVIDNLEKKDKTVQMNSISRQNSRCNYSTNSVEDYYRISIYIPLLDSVLDDLKCRFLNEKSQALLKLSQVIPRNIVETDDEDVYNLIKLVIKYFTFDEYNEINETELKSELNLWKSKWIREKNEELRNISNLDAMTSFELCSEILYPNIKKLLHIIACLPISVASAERSFSTLRRLKTWLRSKMGQDRLCGLALLHIHREIDISVDDIIKRFASLKKRNTDLIL
ncbi:unnamed protein product [Macrosiphum euphorbiae]|uniref:Repressor of the inhibitor of the protein kinase n=1 Tax=Macrosiphum euphorbiae TaxID=13131 RepID=A0AAV0Y1G6_9HEMI|nr:unnamed protein product [Macrosiphum euphorbiae]